MRGQEGAAAAANSIPFVGFGSEPLWSLKSARGWRSLVKLSRATLEARAHLKKWRPDVVFSTGGYGAAPVVFAARSLRIPYVVHEANSVPGRVNRMAAKGAYAFTSVFRTTERQVPGIKVTRTGQPIRVELRAAAAGLNPDPDTVLVLGGSQGSEFLNQNVPLAMAEWSGNPPQVVHATGRAHIDSVRSQLAALPNLDHYRAVPYLETEEIKDAYRTATVAVARSGGTLAELALFRLPSVLVPLPSSADQHQLRNAQEFASMSAATIIDQTRTSPRELREAIDAWISDPQRRKIAELALADWDIPDATERIIGIIEASVNSARI